MALPPAAAWTQQQVATATAQAALAQADAAAAAASAAAAAAASAGGLPVATIAAAGATQGTATPATFGLSIVTPVAANTGVILQGIVKGVPFILLNNGANVLSVYPPAGSAIGALAGNVADGVAPGQTAVYYLQTNAGTQWIRTQ